MTSITTTLARQAIRAWPQHELATKRQIKVLRTGYIKARRILGDKYLLAVPIAKKEMVQ